MNKTDDEIVKEAIRASGYYENENFNLEDEDLDYDSKIKLILAKSLIEVRPDLKEEIDKDIVFIVRYFDSDGSRHNSLPFNCLGKAIKNNAPYDDSEIWSFSISKQDFLTCLYKGDGTKWEYVV